jgi:8-oxoguanine deaminase
MSTLLAKNAEVLVTMDSQRRELKNAGLYVEDGFIKQIGPDEELPVTADTVLDLSRQIVLTHPPLRNTRRRTVHARALPASPGGLDGDTRLAG